MKLAQAEEKELQQLEESLWRSETRFARAYVEHIFADEFVEFGCSGRAYTRREMVETAGDAIHALLPLPEFALRPITENVVLATYVSVTRAAGAARRCRRSSLWLRTAEGWRLTFHQATPLPTTPSEGVE